MEETNFVLLWKEHYEKIDQALALNKQILKRSDWPKGTIRFTIVEQVQGKRYRNCNYLFNIIGHGVVLCNFTLFFRS